MHFALFLLKYSQFIMCYFQVYSKVIQLYMCIYIYITEYIRLWVSQVFLVVKNPSANARDINTGLIPESGRVPGRGHGGPLQYCCLENHSPQGLKELDMIEVTQQAVRHILYIYIDSFLAHLWIEFSTTDSVTPLIILSYTPQSGHFQLQKILKA